MLIPLRHDAPKEALRFRMHEAVVVLELVCAQVTLAESTMKNCLRIIQNSGYHMMGMGETSGNFSKKT